MKVLVLTGLYPSQRHPQRAVFNLNAFRALSRYCQVRVLAPVAWWRRLKTPANLFRAATESQTGIEATFPTFWSVPRLSSVHGSLMYLSLLQRVARTYEEYPFDVVLSAFAYPDGFAACKIGRRFRRPVVTKVLGSDVNELPKYPRIRRQLEWVFRESAQVITVSRALRDKVIALHCDPTKVVVHHNGVDGDLFRPLRSSQFRAELGLPDESDVVLFVGNLVFEKGFDVLLAAFRGLSGQGSKPVRLVVIGDGPLRRMVTREDVSAGVVLLGRCRPGDVAKAMAACDLLCLPSRREGCPNVVLEALASGRPVVASGVGGVPELIGPVNGLIIPPDDVGALRDSLKACLQRVWNPLELRSTVTSLSWDSFGAALYGCLRNAVEAGPPVTGGIDRASVQPVGMGPMAS